jgi:thymidine kinase
MGNLTIALGPMFSGKTTFLVHRADAASYYGPVLYIVHSLDTRDTANVISTHNNHLNISQRKFDVKRVSTLNDVMKPELLEPYDTIVIDEAQFFGEGLYDNVRDLVEKYNKDVIMGGLNGTSDRVPFGSGEFQKCFCIADNIVSLNKNVYCARCILEKKKNYAIFSHRLAKSGDEVVIGYDNYIPVCRDCYTSLN